MYFSLPKRTSSLDILEFIRNDWFKMGHVTYIGLLKNSS